MDERIKLVTWTTTQDGVCFLFALQDYPGAFMVTNAGDGELGRFHVMDPAGVYEEHHVVKAAMEALGVVLVGPATYPLREMFGPATIFMEPETIAQAFYDVLTFA